MELFQARDHHGVELGLGITCNGVSVFKGRTLITTFEWSIIMCFDTCVCACVYVSVFAYFLCVFVCVFCLDVCVQVHLGTDHIYLVSGHQASKLLSILYLSSGI